MKKIAVSAISYINTLPFIYGLKASSIINEMDVIISTPAQAASDLLSKKTQIGIVPAAILPQLGMSSIISDFCIGATSNVDSVLICSNIPIKEVKHIFLDSESRTSVLLSKILLQNYWKTNPSFHSFSIKEESINYSKTYLLIGDKALVHKGSFRYVYDLAQCWIDYTSLPFVFACWCSNVNLPHSFIQSLNDAFSFGISNLEKSLDGVKLPIDKTSALNYLTNNISYCLDLDKIKGLNKFISFI